jgi:predicted NBD/HSP70 family sugar kinase
MTRPAGSAKLLRAMNSSAALAHLLHLGQLTRADLRELTGLSKPTASEMLRLLTDAGLAVVAGRTAGGPGPNAEIYAPNADAAYAVAISVRDTTGEDRPSLGVALGDLTGSIRQRSERWVDFSAVTPDEVVIDTIRDVCRRAGVDVSRLRHIHLGVPGSYERRSDTIHLVDVPGWGEAGVITRIREATAALAGTPPTMAVENDVNLAAVAERHRGVAGNVDGFAMLWLAHGLGLATDLGGTLLRGAHGAAGEIGYVPQSSGGDLQDLVGGPAVIELANGYGVTAATPGDAVTQALGTKRAEDFLAALADRIAFALASVIAMLDPPLVVLAGEVAQAGGARLRDAVVAAMHSTAPLAALGEAVQIAVTAVEDDAVLLGGLDAGLRALRESLISSLAQPPLD